MSKRFIITLATLMLIAVLAGFAILLAKGYTFSSKEKRIVGTGIITVSSEPDAASVFIDGHLTTATNATISSLAPKTYTIRLTKEGFIPWERSVEVKEGIVTPLKVTLFPAIPTIYPLTFNGVVNPTLSPDGSKLGFIVPVATASANLEEQSASSKNKSGVWVWTMVQNQPIAFARSAEPHQIAISNIVDFSNASLRWSPDSKQLLVTLGTTNYLLDPDRINAELRDITPLLEPTLESWKDDIKAKDTARIEAIKDSNLRKIASDTAKLNESKPNGQNLVWSPDETKFMVFQGSLVKVYNLEDGGEHTLPTAKLHIWLPDSTHIILVEESEISVVDFDGSNKAVIYAGNFLDNFVFPWPDSGRLVIISSFPTPTASKPNFYGINLR